MVSIKLKSGILALLPMIIVPFLPKLLSVMEFKVIVTSEFSSFKQSIKKKHPIKRKNNFDLIN